MMNYMGQRIFVDHNFVIYKTIQILFPIIIDNSSRDKKLEGLFIKSVSYFVWPL